MRTAPPSALWPIASQCEEKWRYAFIGLGIGMLIG
jgi:hypothetical protein